MKEMIGDRNSDAEIELAMIVATIYIPVGEVGNVIIFRCQVSSGCRAPKIIEIG